MGADRRPSGRFRAPLLGRRYLDNRTAPKVIEIESARDVSSGAVFGNAAPAADGHQSGGGAPPAFFGSGVRKRNVARSQSLRFSQLAPTASRALPPTGCVRAVLIFSFRRLPLSPKRALERFQKIFRLGGIGGNCCTTAWHTAYIFHIFFLEHFPSHL